MYYTIDNLTPSIYHCTVDVFNPQSITSNALLNKAPSFSKVVTLKTLSNKQFTNDIFRENKADP